LKAKILEIQTSKTLTPKEKADGMQKLLMKQWNDAQERLTPKAAVEKPETPIAYDAERKIVTYYVRSTT
jgi:hypothetical protein